YAGWYPRLWFGAGYLPSFGEFGSLAPHLRFVERCCRKLARMLLYTMMRHGARLERKQMTLFRFVDVGAELFAMTASCVRARMLVKQGRSGSEATQLADHFCRLARRRVAAGFHAMFHNDDVATYKLARQVMEGNHLWLESGIVGLHHALQEVGHTAPETRE